MVIIIIIANFNISWVLIDGGSSYDIMYSNHFEKLWLKKEKLWHYEGSRLRAFNGTITYPRGYVKLMVIMGNGKSTNIVNSQFLMVPCKNVYNSIMDKPFAITLDTVASSVHLKLK